MSGKVSKIRTKIAKTLTPYGVSGDAIDEMTKIIEDDIKCPVFGITQTDVANMRIKHEMGKDVFVYIGRRDWQFRIDGSLVGAGYGLCCVGR